MLWLLCHLSLLAWATKAPPLISKQYKKWLNVSGVDFIDSEIGHAVRESGGTRQKGLFATKDLPEGHVFLRVLLLGAVINIEHAIGDEEFLKYLGPDKLEELNDPTIMTAFVAYCRATQHSIWFRYFESLPDKFTTPLYFPDITELQASPVVDAARDRLAQVAKEYDALPASLKEFVSPPMFQWAYTALLSRSFGLQVKDQMGDWQHAACLVPGADMLNTGAITNADCGTNDASTHFECFTTSPVKKFEELLVPYGSFINEPKLLLDYGFVLGSNFTARVILDPKWTPANKHKPTAGSVLHVTADEFEAVKSAAQRGFKKAEETAVCAFVINRLQDHLSAYRTSIEEDEKILASPPSASFDAQCRGCFHSAVKLRLGEKRVYQALLNKFQEWWDELQQQNPASSAPASSSSDSVDHNKDEKNKKAEL